MVRLLRLFRGLRGSTGLLRRLLLSKQETTLAAIFLLIAAVMVFASTAILVAEEGANGTIDTAEEAIWFTLSTMTTVGYGDVYPVTSAGRVVAALTMMAGIGIFGAFTALVASLLVKSSKVEGQMVELLDELRKQADSIESLRGEIRLLHKRDSVQSGLERVRDLNDTNH